MDDGEYAVTSSAELLVLHAGHVVREAPGVLRRLPVYAVLARSAALTVLFDSCPPENWETRWGSGISRHYKYEPAPGSKSLMDLLTRVGVSSGDIDVCVLSHLHFDHAGGARALSESGVPLLCHKDELAAAKAGAEEGDAPYLSSDFDGLPFALKEGDVKLTSQVSLIHVPGHTPGTYAMRVRGGPQSYIFCSDSAFDGRDYGIPSRSGSVQWDLGQWSRSLRKLHGLAAEDGAIPFFGHDERQLSHFESGPASPMA